MILASFLITFWDPLPERSPHGMVRFDLPRIRPGIGNPTVGPFVALPVTQLMIGPDHHFLAQVRKRTPILRLVEKMDYLGVVRNGGGCGPQQDPVLEK